MYKYIFKFSIFSLQEEAGTVTLRDSVTRFSTPFIVQKLSMGPKLIG